MKIKDVLDQVLQSLLGLSSEKKIALGAAFVVSLAALVFLSFQISKPITSPLYSNLSSDDLNSMSRVLSENGIEFIIRPEQGSIEVESGLTAQTRMLLAERGLPTTEKSGYELFDQVNTLGLTSFMQGITNKRAIEGELVRTIQMINGVNSARVHLVIEDRNVFRRGATTRSSASVVLKTYGKLPARSIGAIRHMVSAAVPGLEASNVTIVGADGTLMTTKDDIIGNSTKLVELEREYEQDVEEKITLALGAHLGTDNLRVSASVKLNNDKRRVDEIIFDPDSRIERSVQIVREAGNTENKETDSPVTIDQNLPEEDVGGNASQSSSENSERREELMNYEINEKKVSLVSDGYAVEKLSVAILVNRSRVEELLGAGATSNAYDEKIEELEQIVSAAVSLSADRGDQVAVKLVNFLTESSVIDGSESSLALNFMAMHFGTLMNSLGVIIAAVLFAVLGIRPVLAFLNKSSLSERQQAQLLGTGHPEALLGSDNPVDGQELAENGQVPAGDLSQTSDGSRVGQSNFARDEANVDLSQMAEQEIQITKQLEQMVTQSKERSAIAIKHWMQNSTA